MTSITRKITRLISHPYFPYLFLTLIICGIYYKLFLFGKVPFPGDLLIGSYLPWLEYYKMPVQNPLISDVFSQLILWKYLSIDAFKSFQWPLWNSYSFTGNPLLANYQSAALYPLNILLILPKYFGWGIFIFSQTLIATLTFYLFASEIAQSKIARLIGSILFSLGSLMTTWVELGTAVHGMAWLPLALYAIKKFCSTKKLRFISLLIISLSLIVFSGNTQITTYSYIVVFLYFLYENYKDNFNFKKTSLFFLALITSILITLPQLLPSYELLGKSIRQSESYTTEYNHGLLHIENILKFFIADYFGNPVTRNYWGSLNYFETSVFLGSLTLSILIYGLFKLRTKESVFFLLLFITSLLLVFDNPLSQAIYSLKIPLLTSSYASRALFICLLSSSVLSTLATNHLSKNQSLNLFLKTTLWSWAVVLGVILGTFLTQFYIQKAYELAPSEVYLKAYLNSEDYNLKYFSIALKNSLVPLILLTTFLLIIFFIYKFKSIKNKTNLIMIGLLFFSILDLGRYFLKFNPFVINDFIFPNVPALEFLQKQPGLFRVGREHAEVLPPNTWTAYNLQSLEGYDPLYLNRYGQFMHYLNGGDIRKGSSARYAELSNKYSSPFIDVANVKYFVIIGRDKEGQIPGDLINYKFHETGYNKVFQDKSTMILENPYALERVYFIPTFKVVNTQNVGNIIMADPNFDPRITALLEKDLNIATTSGKGKASIVSYGNNKVEIKTETETDEVLILADQFEEGWKAKIDNIETPISPANYIFRAIKVPKGTHEITFEYLPYSFNIGVKISLVSIFTLLIITLISLKKKIF